MNPKDRDDQATSKELRPRIGAAASIPSSTSEGIAPQLLSQAARRLRVISITCFVVTLMLWVGINLALGTLRDEFRSPSEWTPPCAMLVASIALWLAARSGRFAPSTIIRIGLVYEVVVSYAIAGGTLLGAFKGIPAVEMTPDRVGMTYVAPWMLFFTLLVPAKPREALFALILSATAVPFTYAIQTPSGLGPTLGTAKFISIFVLPYVVTTGISYVAARMLHRLGVEIRLAREMGSYRLEGLLGRGGMGEVWRASHHALARPAAIKVIRRDLIPGGDSAARVAAARFEQEAQVIASLQSAHTIQLYDFGAAEDGTLFYVMELLHGIDLDHLVRRFGPLPAERVVHLLLQVCESLAEAHERGVVHRDIKPANIFLCRYGIEHDFVKVLDFGLVKQTTALEAAGPGLTVAGVVAGTPHFMAPEIALGHGGIDGRVDIYAVGCLAHWLLTGRVVFEADSATAVILAHVQHEPNPPSLLSELPIPPALDRIVLDCLAKDPRARPATAGQLASRLAAIQFAHPWQEEDAARWWNTCHPVGSTNEENGLERERA